MSFLNRLRSLFGNCTRGQSEGKFDKPLDATEPLARFVFPKTTRLKPDAFLPNGVPLQTSVSRIVGLSDAQIWDIGNSIAVQRQRTLRARADIAVSSVLATGLQVDPDNIPERHANIVGWPSDKDEQLMLATELAETATLHVKPNL